MFAPEVDGATHSRKYTAQETIQVRFNVNFYFMHRNFITQTTTYYLIGRLESDHRSTLKLSVCAL